MVLDNSPIAFLLLETFTLVWLVVISILLFKTISNYNRLTAGTTNKTLSEVLHAFFEQNKLTAEEHKKVLVEIKKLRVEGLAAISKIGFVRYNPFSDTGGDQSFSLALLNGHQDGFVITSLYGRAGVRWHIKTIKSGKAQEFALSKEEEEALKKVS